MISVAGVPSAFPERNRNGVPAQRLLRTSNVASARVSVCRSGSTPGSSTYDGFATPPIVPAVYRARREDAAGSSPHTVVARSTALVAARKSTSSSVVGSSIASTASTWRRWLWIMSTSAPAES
ncbi:hypothetical protein SRABI76_03439 [Microbacterium oxydans]|nr:hypothetical protein SRABI76_03439 [Microbacterium oxydans]